MIADPKFRIWLRQPAKRYTAAEFVGQSILQGVLMETAAAPSVSGTKAGFWIRLVAYIIDVLIFGIPAAILSAIFGLSKQGYPVNNLLTILFFVIYFTYLFSANSFMGPGLTIGMRVLNLRVISTSGGSLDMSKALIR